MVLNVSLYVAGSEGNTVRTGGFVAHGESRATSRGAAGEEGLALAMRDVREGSWGGRGYMELDMELELELERAWTWTWSLGLGLT